MSCSFTVALKSRNRVSGSANAYTLALPALPRGNYMATFKIAADVAETTELCVKWAGSTRHYEAIQGDAYTTLCTFDVYQGEGTLFISDPQNSVDVLFRSATTGLPSAMMPEAVIAVLFECI
jgi:hypothetical protein